MERQEHISAKSQESVEYGAKADVVPTGDMTSSAKGKAAARDIMELYTMREIIEGASAALAASHASAMEIETMNELNSAFAEAGTDTEEMARLNRLFHEAIYRAARNQYLDLALTEIQDSIGLLGNTTFIVPGRPLRAVEEHLAIIDAIAKRDGKSAEDLARSHIRGALSARMRILQERTLDPVE